MSSTMRPSDRTAPAITRSSCCASSSSDVPIVATNGLPENLDMNRDDKVQVADVSYPPTEYVGWLIVDQLGRAILDEPVENTELPLQLFDKENLPPSNDFEELWPQMTEYQSAFKEKWGV